MGSSLDLENTVTIEATAISSSWLIVDGCWGGLVGQRGVVGLFEFCTGSRIRDAGPHGRSRSSALVCRCEPLLYVVSQAWPLLRTAFTELILLHCIMKSKVIGMAECGGEGAWPLEDAREERCWPAG